VVGAVELRMELAQIGLSHAPEAGHAFVEGWRVAWIFGRIWVAMAPEGVRCQRVGLATLAVYPRDTAGAQGFQFGRRECRHAQHRSQQVQQVGQVGTVRLEPYRQPLRTARDRYIGLERLEPIR